MGTISKIATTTGDVIVQEFSAATAAAAEALAEIDGKVHYQTGSSSVRCGAKMRHWRDNPTGWDLGTVTVDPAAVTCPRCARILAPTRPATKKCVGCDARIPISDPAVCGPCDRLRLADTHPILRGYDG